VVRSISFPIRPSGLLQHLKRTHLVCGARWWRFFKVLQISIDAIAGLSNELAILIDR
jgi:hypothetical protein